MTNLDDIRKRFASADSVPQCDLRSERMQYVAEEAIRIATDQEAELAEARVDLADLRDQARMAGIWALLDPGERTAMPLWEQRNYADAAAYCAALPETK